MNNKILFIIKSTALMIIPFSIISGYNSQFLISLKSKNDENKLIIPIKNNNEKNNDGNNNQNKISIKNVEYQSQEIKNKTSKNKAKKNKKSINLISSYDLQIHAKIIPVKSSIISSRIDATVKNVYVKEGEYFRKNQKILDFDCVIIKSDADKAKAQMENAKVYYESSQKLYDLNGLDKVSLAKSESEYKSLSAEYKIKEQLMKYCTVKAPFAGQMTDVYVHEFETISRGDNLFKAVDDNNLIVKAFVPSEWVSKIHKGDNFEIKLIENNKIYKGKITRIVKDIDSVSRTIKIIGKLDEKYEDISPGMSGYITSLTK